MVNIDIVAGARPNFVKIAPIIHAIKLKQNEGFNISYRLIHTGQHYDKNMSESFFIELGIPAPDINLGCGGGTQAEQTASIMIAFEKELLKYPTELVIVVGDVTSTLACSIVAKKLSIRVAHVEAGIRSGDLTMPEEINRMVTDSIADYFFTTSVTAGENLLRIGVPPEYIFFVGNTMIDTLLNQEKRFKRPLIWDKIGLKEKGYLVMTLHRPSNVDEESNLKYLLEELVKNSRNIPIVFPVHPRTIKSLKKFNSDFKNLYLIDPLSYLEFNYLVKHCKAVITDSGGITEETTVLGVPCMTLRDSTERPETCTIGTNELLGSNPNAIAPAFDRLFGGRWKTGSIPDRWDGMSAHRIIDYLLKL